MTQHETNLWWEKKKRELAVLYGVAVNYKRHINMCKRTV